MGGLSLEGIDRTAELLSRYDPASRTWQIEKSGTFWESVQRLHQEPPGALTGDPAPRVAIIDDGFDLTIPALRDHTHFGDGAGAAHGTTVALLVLEVIPHARLLLYACAPHGKLDAALVSAAVKDAAERGARVINLSMSLRRPTHEWFDQAGFLKSLDLDGSDLEFAYLRGLADLPFRDWLTIPPTPVGDAVRGLTDFDGSVVAAAGNQNNTLASPAVLSNVFAVGFIAEVRSFGKDGLEQAAPGDPTYAQSNFTDYAVVQPPDVLGSSFATPLLSGVVAATCRPGELPEYRESMRLGSLASQMWLRTRGDGQWSDSRQGVVSETFLRAVRRSPHHHELDVGPSDPCSACSFFASGLYNDFGIFKLSWSDFVGAEQLLRTVRAFAPENVFAAANLAATYAAIADTIPRDSEHADEIVTVLRLAEQHSLAAVSMRPEHLPYRHVLATIQDGIADPLPWRYRPDPTS